MGQGDLTRSMSRLVGFVLGDLGFLGAVPSLGYMSVDVVSFQVKNGYVGGSMSCICHVVV